MFRRVMVVVLIGSLLFFALACGRKKTKNPLAQIDSKQPEKVLFDKAMEAMRAKKYEVVRAGAEILVAGSAVFGKGDIGRNVEQLLRVARTATVQRV